MIENARKFDPKGCYVHADINFWQPLEKLDVVHSMEVIYYFKDPGNLLNHIYNFWLNPDGLLILGLDFYLVHN